MSNRQRQRASSQSPRTNAPPRGPGPTGLAAPPNPRRIPLYAGLAVLGAAVGLAGTLVQAALFPGGLLLALAASAGLFYGGRVLTGTQLGALAPAVGWFIAVIVLLGGGGLYRLFLLSILLCARGQGYWLCDGGIVDWRRLFQGSSILFRLIVIAVAEMYALVWVVRCVWSSLGLVALSSAFLCHGDALAVGGSSMFFGLCGDFGEDEVPSRLVVMPCTTDNKN